jgi:hypothetical protein
MFAVSLHVAVVHAFKAGLLDHRENVVLRHGLYALEPLSPALAIGRDAFEHLLCSVVRQSGSGRSPRDHERYDLDAMDRTAEFC